MAVCDVVGFVTTINKANFRCNYGLLATLMHRAMSRNRSRVIENWYIYIYGHFPKRYSKQKRINLTFECRWHVLHFLLVAGPQLNAVVLQGSARFAQGLRKVLIVQLGRCRKPESRWFWQTRGKIVRKLRASSRKLLRKLGLPEPPRAHAPPHVLCDSQHYSTLSYSTLSYSHVPPAQKCTAQATLICFEI